MTAVSYPQRVKFVTLGCKVNQYETQGMREALSEAGLQISDANADHDFVVINTCTVTEQADKENRYWIRRMRRENPAAKIIVTGCYVEKNRAEIEALEEVDLVLANHQKADLKEVVFAGCATPEMQDAETDRMKKRAFTPLKISNFQGRGRAFIKIQDGCNHSCSFCKVVLVRGRSRSRLMQDVVDEAARLSDAGYREIVLAGIQLGAYGLDQGRENALSDVIEACADVRGIERIRLSSIEPTDVTPALIATLKSVEKCCPQLHIPLQSGDDDVLRRMNRRHSRGFYIDLIARLRDALPDFELSMDVMAGFAGESEKAFENSMDLLRIVKPLKTHVFPYSPREGTRAALLDEHWPVELIRARVKEMIRLGEALAARRRSHYVGRTMDVLVEHPIKDSGLVQGHTANYLKVCFQANESVIGKIIPVELLGLESDMMLGRAAGPVGD